MKRSGPLPRSRAKPRRTLSPRCTVRGCKKKQDVETLCITHAEARADRLFSRHIRDRDGRCTAAKALRDIECRGALQAAHIVGRRRYAVRFDDLNVHALCQAHHYHVDRHGSEHAKYRWGVYVLGSIEAWDVLMMNAEQPCSRRTAAEAALRRFT